MPLGSWLPADGAALPFEAATEPSGGAMVIIDGAEVAGVVATEVGVLTEADCMEGTGTVMLGAIGEDWG